MQVRNFSASEVNNYNNILVNYTCFKNWEPDRPEPGPRGDYFFYTIYEADNWPTGLKYNDVYVGTQKYTLDYRSDDPCYDIHSFSINDVVTNGVTCGSTNPLQSCSRYSMGLFTDE